MNGDGNPDLLVVEQGAASPFLAVYFGDGHGNFTQDTNTYFVSPQYALSSTMPTRLNNQAPPFPNDNKLDVLWAATYGSPLPSVISLLNQTNPPPAKPAPLTTTTTLQTSLAMANPGAAITLTASVFGTNPSGSVTFCANGNRLATEALVNGTATLATSFANTGSYSVTAAYEGDGDNTASTSPAVGITITPATTTHNSAGNAERGQSEWTDHLEGNGERRQPDGVGRLRGWHNRPGNSHGDKRCGDTADLVCDGRQLRYDGDLPWRLEQRGQHLERGNHRDRRT